MLKFYWNLMNSLMTERDGDELKHSAVVFSPHPDDETLGCGGTIIQKINAGANVCVVFMTDGCRSHPHLISEEQLKSVRKTEALAATQILGVERNNVHFLEFKDKELWQNQKTVTDKVIDILLYYKPKEVFIPYHKEIPSDHWATNRIILQALQKYREKITVYEYPIWFWNQWPWVPTSFGLRLKTIRILKNTVLSNVHFLSDFRFSVATYTVLESKRAALHEYKSQMTRLIPDQKWITLPDVSRGKFLNCFFQPHEIFRGYCLYG
ncbi:MAG: PIG-L family deacetylase [wastewater metagenome]|nr:PIG-L family deacetylase [Candidatus Loosdrechtia aerotolerans]